MGVGGRPGGVEGERRGQTGEERGGGFGRSGVGVSLLAHEEDGGGRGGGEFAPGVEGLSGHGAKAEEEEDGEGRGGRARVHGVARRGG